MMHLLFQHVTCDHIKTDFEQMFLFVVSKIYLWLVSLQPLFGLDEELDPLVRRVGADFRSVLHREAKTETKMINSKRMLDIY